MTNMKKYKAGWLAALFLFVAVFSGFGTAGSLSAQTSGFSREQIIDEIAKGTGMARDAVALGLGNTPAALDKASEILTSVQILSKLAEAKDDEAMETALDWALSKVQDKLLPGAAGTALSAVTLYKVTLEGIRDRIVLPKLDENMFAEYKKYRIDDIASKQGEDSSSMSFDKLSARSDLGYHMIKEKIYQEMIKSRGFEKKFIGKQFENYLRAQIDAYWQTRMEARFQREYISENLDAMLKELWKDARQTLASPQPKSNNPADTDPENLAAVQRYIEDCEAEVQRLTERSHSQGYTEAQFRFNWVVRPYLEDGCMVVASEMQQKPTSKHEWTGLSSFGTNEVPFRIPIGQIKARYPAKTGN